MRVEELRGRVVILDSSALFHIRSPEILRTARRIVTTSLVADEVRDSISRAVFDVLNVEVVDVSTDEVSRVKRTVRTDGLSDQDVSLIALAERLRVERPVVLTDDSRLARELRRRGIEVVRVFFGRRTRRNARGNT